MEIAKIGKVKLSDSVIENRKYLFNKLKANATVTDFLNANKLDDEFLRNNLQRFDDWLHQLDLKSQCEKSDKCLLMDGYYEDLYYDGLLQKHLVPCSHTLAKLSDEVKLSNYIVSDIPHSLTTVTLGSILRKQESIEYIEAVTEISSYLDTMEGHGYYIHGDVGVGKTYLLSAITNEIVKRGKKVAFVHTPTFANKIKSMISKRQSIDDLLNDLKHVHVLVLDDIGTEGVSDWLRDDILLSILNFRMDSGKTCFYTSNLSMNQLEQYYSVNNKNEYNELAARRLMERIRMTSKEINMSGFNRRNYIG